MAAEGKKGEPKRRITGTERFKYIGFDVFPGKPKDLFKSDAEKTKHVDAVKAKRDKGDIIRDECTLLEERVSSLDRIVLTIACLVMVGSLFIPWFSVYNEIVEETTAAVSTAVEEVAIDSTLATTETDSLESMAALGNEEATTEDLTASTETDVADESIAEVNDPMQETASEEVIHGYVAKKKIHNEYSRLAGYGVLLSVGSVGSYVFSSGLILMLTGVLFLLYVLLALGLPAYTLYGVYGMKGDADEKALALKKILRFNWIPVIVFVATMLLSFFGAEYGFDSQSLFTSLGTFYGPGVFLNSVSYGVFVSLGAFVLVALKGVEI